MAEALPGLGAIGEDRLLDGKLVLRQPRKGHRAGSDAVEDAVDSCLRFCGELSGCKFALQQMNRDLSTRANLEACPECSLRSFCQRLGPASCPFDNE